MRLSHCILLLVAFVQAARLPAVSAPSAGRPVVNEAAALKQSGKRDEARAICENALNSNGLTDEERAGLLLIMAEIFAEDSEDEKAFNLVEKIRQTRGANVQTKAEANLLVARIYSNYGGSSARRKVLDACEGVLGLEGVSNLSIAMARREMFAALNVERDFKASREVLAALVASMELSPLERATFQTELGRTFFLQSSFVEARAALQKAEAFLESEKDEAGSQKTRAQIHLLRGLCLLEEGDLHTARELLLQVPRLPGQSEATPEAREALVRLSLRNLITEKSPTMKVLFIGSSHTIRGSVPLLVEQIAASTATDAPRIRAGEHVRMGTGLQVFWEEGEAHDTVRGRMAAEPWDAVVVESFFKQPKEVLERYLTRYTELAWSKGAQLVIYESPVAKATAYPDGFKAFHLNNVDLHRKYGVPLAPSVHAWMQVLGPTPRPEAFESLYSDWIHSTMKGAYLTACCLYSALTGLSAEGLAFPKEVSGGEAAVFQKIAWQAFLDSQ